jgi:hypothetical protein
MDEGGTYGMPKLCAAVFGGEFGETHASLMLICGYPKHIFL